MIISYFSTNSQEITKMFDANVGFEALKSLLQKNSIHENPKFIHSLKLNKQELCLNEAFIQSPPKKVVLTVKFDQLTKRIMYSIKTENSIYQKLKTSTEIPKEEIKFIKDADGNQISLGRGKFGEVFKGKMYYSFDVAIKEIKMSNYQNLKNKIYKELKLMTSINHQNVLKVYGFTCFNKSKIGLIMELLDTNLETFIKTNKKRIKNHFKWNLIKQMIQSIKFLHERGIIHRDIKPSNFLLKKKTGILKIADFGLAKFEDEKSSFSTEGIKGTIRFIPQEILNSDVPKYSQKSDIFGLGMTILYLVVEQIPFFKVLNDNKVILKICKGESPNIPSTIDPIFKDLIEKCIDPNPEKRNSLEEIEKFIEENEKKFLKKYPVPLEKTELLLKKLEESKVKIKELKEEKKCVICVDKPKSIIFLPCGYLVSCEECAKILERCPICRRSIKTKEKFFA